MKLACRGVRGLLLRALHVEFLGQGCPVPPFCSLFLLRGCGLWGKNSLFCEKEILRWLVWTILLWVISHESCCLWLDTGIYLEDKQLNNSSFSYLLKARRECNSERCQRQRWREGPENWVILKSSVTMLFIKISKYEEELKTKQETFFVFFFLNHCILFYFEYSVQHWLLHPKKDWK